MNVSEIGLYCRLSIIQPFTGINPTQTSRSHFWSSQTWMEMVWACSGKNKHVSTSYVHHTNPTCGLLVPKSGYNDLWEWQWDVFEALWPVGSHLSDPLTYGTVTFSWFAVHAVSMNYTNQMVSSDNMGYASYLLEQEKNIGFLPGEVRFHYPCPINIFIFSIIETWWLLAVSPLQLQNDWMCVLGEWLESVESLCGKNK